MASDINTVIANSNIIKNETIIDNNSATRVGTNLVDLGENIVLKEDTASKGVANGHAPLDANSQVPISNLPAALLGSAHFAGLWNANTNTPTIINGAGSNGYFYRVDVAGTQDLGDGNIVFAVGDAVIYSTADNKWHRIGAQTPAADAIFLAAGFTPDNSAITGADSLQEVAEKSQGQINALGAAPATIQTPIGVTSTGTNPTKGTTLVDRIIHSAYGDKIDCSYQFYNSAVGTAGTGDYLFELPTGMTFDNTYTMFTTGAATDRVGANFRGIGDVNIIDGNNLWHAKGFIVPYDTNHFRIYLDIVNGANNQTYLGGASFGFIHKQSIQTHFSFYRTPT